jgi:hypothetical protein
MQKVVLHSEAFPDLDYFEIIAMQVFKRISSERNYVIRGLCDFLMWIMRLFNAMRLIRDDIAISNISSNIPKK